MDFQLLSNIVNIDLDGATGWVKATRAIFLWRILTAFYTARYTTKNIENGGEGCPSILLLTSQGNTQTLMASQQAIDQEASLSANSVQGQARPMRLIEALPAESTNPPAPVSRKRRRRRPLPLPIIQISQALPCLLRCKTTTMTALVDFGAGLHDPGPLYPFCEEHLQTVLVQREATGLSLRVIVERLIGPDPS